MAHYSRHYRPALKGNIDIQLQTAFEDGNWALVKRLADRRSKSAPDPYLEAVKVCAESQSESPLENCAAITAIDALVRSSTVPADVDTIQLYEWACNSSQADINYSDTLGTLRLRWVKANPRSPAAVSCLQACVQHWDLINAQQIAAVLDKSSSSWDRRYMYWNITLTHLLSTSPQCPDEKRRIYGTLALKQLERAAELTLSAGAERGSAATAADRDLRSEEEVNLFYRMLAINGSPDNFLVKAQDPGLGAIKQLTEGRKYLFMQAVSLFESRAQWDALYDLCIQGLKIVNEDGSPSLLASDWRVWKSLVHAATKKPDQELAFSEIRDSIQRFSSVVPRAAQMYMKNFGLALLEVAFSMQPVLPSSHETLDHITPRVGQLSMFIEQHCTKISVFDDVKGYAEKLCISEIRCLLEKVFPLLISRAAEPFRKTALHVTHFKMRYLFTTCPQTIDRQKTTPGSSSSFRCRICEAMADDAACQACLEKIVLDVRTMCVQLGHESGDTDDQLARLDRDPHVDLALVAGLSLLKLSGMHQRSQRSVSPMSRVTVPQFLQLVLLLDTQLRRTPEDIPLRVLLVKLYLIMGCASLAHQLWVRLDVKRTIQDALSPLFFDRISSLAPGLFHTASGKPLMEPLRKYYQTCFRDRAPVKIWDAFSAGSYTSILDMAEYNDRLRKSCTRVMTVVEERRAARAFGGKIEDTDDVDIFVDISDETACVNVTDHGALPNLESSHGPPLAEILQIGPGLSDVRCHLSLLAEQYFEVISFKATKDHKPAKIEDVAARDRLFLMETLCSLNSSFASFLHLQEARSQLTAAEHSYYTILSLLSSLVLTALTTNRAEQLPALVSATLVPSVTAVFGALRTSVFAYPKSNLENASVFYAMTDQLALSCFRDSGLAIKHSAEFVVEYNEKEMARDRTGKANLHKDVVAEMRRLGALGAKATGEVKARVGTLKGMLAEPGWLDRMTTWTLGRIGDDGPEDTTARSVYEIVGGQVAVEEWIGRVLESWDEGVRGWGMMRTD